MILKAENVNKKIKRNLILSDINLTLESGKVYGFVGRNGSGKTMLFRALSGLMNIDSGIIMLDDKVLHKDMSILPDLGIVIENAGLYPELTGFNNLKMLAKLNNKVTDEEIKNAIDRVGLDPNDKKTFRKYSLGMKQRIILAQAIMEKPKIIMMDEPTNALDESGIDMIRNVILEEKERGALILIASHNKEDISLLADEVFYLKNGVIEKGGVDNEG